MSEASPPEEVSVDESELTEKQREWLALSRKIGPGAMTKSERLSLERLYKEMLPGEQKSLYEFIQSAYGQKDAELPEETTEDPIALMEKRVWKPPSPALKSIFSKRLGVKGRVQGKEDPSDQS
jgi:hypothetical protein